MQRQQNHEFLNYYNDQRQELIFNDLGDMGKVRDGLNNLLKTQALQHTPVGINSGFRVLAMVNELNRNVDAFIFIECDSNESVIALVVFVLNRIEGHEFVYSVGYFVEEGLRGNGLAKKLVSESVDALKTILARLGPNIDIGPDESFSYALETVVSQQNEPSNKLARNLLHGGGDVGFGNELYSKVASYIYTRHL